MKKVLILLMICLLFITSCSSQSSSDNEVLEQESTTEEIIESETEEVDVFEKGSIEDNIYTNKSLNLKFTPTKNMVMLTEEEMYANLQQGLDVVSNGNEAYKNIDIKDLDVVYELYLTDISNNSNIQFTAEKISLSNLTAEQYVDAVMTQIGQVDDFEIVSQSEIEDYNLCGLDFKAITAEMNYQNVSLKETIMCRVFGDRMLQLTLTYFDDAALDQMISCFSNIE